MKNYLSGVFKSLISRLSSVGYSRQQSSSNRHCRKPTIFFFKSEDIKGQRTNQSEHAVIGKSRLLLVLRVSSVPKDWVGTLTFANVSRYLAQGGRGAAKENICAKVKNISLNNMKWYFGVTSIRYQTAP